MWCERQISIISSYLVWIIVHFIRESNLLIFVIWCWVHKITSMIQFLPREVWPMIRCTIHKVQYQFHAGYSLSEKHTNYGSVWRAFILSSNSRPCWELSCAGSCPQVCCLVKRGSGWPLPLLHVCGSCGPLENLLGSFGFHLQSAKKGIEFCLWQG